MSPTVLAVEDLTFAYEPGEKQVSSVRFDLRAGRTFGILGGNECGKTTLAHLIMGNLAAGSGTIRLFESRPLRHRLGRHGCCRGMLACSAHLYSRADAIWSPSGC